VALDLGRLRSIARGEINAETGVTPVTALQGPSVTPQNPKCNASYACNVSKTISAESGQGRRYGGRYDDLAGAPELGQEAADQRNRRAVKTGMSDRWCACGTMATVALGRFRQTLSNPEGVSRWVCSECFGAATKLNEAANDPR
jgi:hypothetical protein